MIQGAHFFVYASFTVIAFESSSFLVIGTIHKTSACLVLLHSVHLSYYAPRRQVHLHLLCPLGDPNSFSAVQQKFYLKHDEGT